MGLDLPTIQIPKRISREYIISHPNFHFLYSSSLLNTPPFGQSRAAKGLSNTTAIPVRYSLCSSSGYFSDNIVTVRSHIILPSILAGVKAANGNPIIPIPRIGCGRSRMLEFAPSHHKWMMDEINKIKYQNIEYV